MTAGATYAVDGWRGGGAPARAWMAGAGILLVLGLAGFVVHPLLGLGVLALFAVPLFVVAPRYALLLFVALLPFDAVSSLEGEGTMSLTRLLGVALLGGWVLHVLIEGRRIRITRPAWALALYVGFAAVSLGWAVDPGVAVRALATLVQLLVLAIMTANVVEEPRDVQRVLDVLLASAVVLALLILWELPPDGKRATFTFAGDSVDPNFVAATLALPAVAAVGLGTARGGWGWWRQAALVPIALAVFLTGSRGGGIALVAGLAFVGALRRRIGLGVAAIAVALTVLLPFVVPQTVSDKLWSRYANAEQDRLSGRVDIWRVALAMAEDRPIQGTGYGGFSDAFYHYMLTSPVDPHFARAHSRGNRASHNIYLGTLAELGIVGLGLLVAALVAHARALWRARRAALRRRDDEVGRLCLALLGLLATLAIAGSTIDLLTTKTAWVLLALMQATACFAPPAAGARPPRPARERRRAA